MVEELLSVHFSVQVPLYIAELQKKGGPSVADFLLAQQTGQAIAARDDRLLHRRKKKGEAAENPRNCLNGGVMMAAKGLGAMLAEGKMFMEIAHDVVVKCPVCGRLMANNGVIWICEQGRNMPQALHDALQAQGYDPWAFYAHDGAVDYLAAIADETGKILISLEPLRDRGRWGGWAIRPAVSGLNPVQMAELINTRPWVWWEWVPESIKMVPGRGIADEG